MANQDDEPERTTPSGALSAAEKHPQHAMDRAKEVVAGTELRPAADAASALPRDPNSSPTATNSPRPKTS